MRKILLIFGTILALYGGFSDEFYELDRAKRKVAFIEHLVPIITEINENIEAERKFCLNFINEMWKSGFVGLDEQRYREFLNIITSYKIKNIFKDNEIYLKMQPVPVSLALAQAALESGWGNSRFTKEANNIFGHWTWDGSGLIPTNRESGKRHTIRIFDSLHDSVAMYALNLNSNEAYDEFRKMRFDMALRGEKFSGLRAAKTMQNYSELGDEYIHMLQDLIKQFELNKFDE